MINIYLVYKITDILQKLFSFRTDYYTTSKKNFIKNDIVYTNSLQNEKAPNPFIIRD